MERLLPYRGPYPCHFPRRSWSEEKKSGREDRSYWISCSKSRKTSIEKVCNRHIGAIDSFAMPINYL